MHSVCHASSGHRAGAHGLHRFAIVLVRRIAYGERTLDGVAPLIETIPGPGWPLLVLEPPDLPQSLSCADGIPEEVRELLRPGHGIKATRPEHWLELKEYGIGR